MKKSILMLLVLFSILLIGCQVETISVDSIDSHVEQVDKNKTQLYIGNLLGGYGEGWLYKVKKRFEDFYKDFSFEPGKKGIQIYIDSHRDTYKGDVLVGRLGSVKQEIIFTESISYYDFVNQNAFADITDIVKETLSEYGENRSIENKISLDQRNFLTAKDGKYYALPFYEAYAGIIYDVDLFDQKRFYFAKNKNNGNNGFILSRNDQRSAGPDGEFNTYDDGLPSTYEEFVKLMDYMANNGVKPITWTGKYQEYVNKLAASLAVDADGYDNARILTSFDGELTNIVESIDENGKLTFKPKTTIDRNNGYLTFQTSGRYYALKFIEQIVKNPKYYSTNAYNNSKSHLGAQEDFLYSKYITNEPIAMLIEGSWWENEANGIFHDMITQGYGEEASKYNRNFAFLPYPKPTSEDVGTSMTLMNINNSFCFINASINETKLAVAKKFLQFCHTDESLIEFTIETNTPKPYQYDLSEEDLQKLSNFGRSLYNLHNTTRILHPYSYNSIYLSNPSSFDLFSTFSGSVNGIPYTVPSLALKENKNVNAVNYFWAITKKYNETWWNSTILN